MPQMGECQVDMEVDDTPAEEVDAGEQTAPREELVLLPQTFITSETNGKNGDRNKRNAGSTDSYGGHTDNYDECPN